jgi:exodeoxyribonuclease-3
MAISVATWNINGTNARLETARDWLGRAAPDVACLQEIKCIDDNFPTEAFESLGYNVATHGQKSFNGVALLSKLPLEDVTRGLAGAEGDEQARYIEAVVSAPGGGSLRVASLYLPNGNPPDSEKYPYKLAWMERLSQHAEELLALEEPFVLAGDYNVIPSDIDARKPAAWVGDALFLPATLERFRALAHLGLRDAVRACDWRDRQYTFWDYQAGAWQSDNGIRIDHLMLSPQAADRLSSVAIERAERGREKPSDHVPVVARFDL